MKRILLFLITITLLPQASWAHSRWKLDGNTPPWNGFDNNKSKDCGPQLTTNHTNVDPDDDDLELKFDVTVHHDGKFRIEFLKNDESFKPIEDTKVTLESFEDDGIGGTKTVEVELPEEPCSSCTIRLVYEMYDQPATPAYYSCALIATDGSGGEPQAPPTEKTADCAD